jgi:hypothetical protein
MKILCLIALFLLLTPSLSFAEDFKSYTVQLNGTAGLVNSGNTLRVAPLAGGVGSAFITTPFTINSDTSFSTFFQFRIGDGSGADGMLFVVQNDGAGAGASGGGGGGLGFNGIDNSIGVEIDEWNNGEWSDPNNNHMGIDTNGSLTSLTTITPAVNLDSGDSYYLWVDYNGATNDLSVFFNTSNSKPGSPDMTQNLDLAAIVGAEGYVGFVGSTGGANNNHDVEEWTVSWDTVPSASIATPIPTTSTWALTLLVLLILGFTTAYLVPRKQ